jgi:hypothetical protein
MEEETAQSAQKIEKWIIPFGTSLDTLNTILKAFYAAGADTKFVGYEEVIKRGVNRNAVVNNLSFLVYLKALTRNEQDSKLYKFTDLGFNYSKAAYEGNKENMSSAIKSLFESSFKELLDFINLKKEKLTFNDIFNYAKSMARIKEDPKYPWGVNPAYQVGIFTLVDMLILADFLDESFKPSKEATVKAGPRSPRRKLPERVEAEKQALEKLSVIPPTFQIGTQMNVQVIVDTKDKDSISNFLDMMRTLKKLSAEEETQEATE